MFQRVRSKSGPPTEFDIPLGLFEARRDSYEALGVPHERYQGPSFISVDEKTMPRQAAPKTRRRKKPAQPSPAGGENEVTHAD